MRRLLMITAAVCALGYAAAHAADKQGRFVAMGAGRTICAQWLEIRKTNDIPRFQGQAWVMGFISAYNAYTHDGRNVADGLQPAALWDAVDQYCGANKEHKVVQAVRVLVAALGKRA